MATAQQAIQDIEDHIRKCGGPYSAWYAGIASDPKTRLFNDHGVSEKSDAWIYEDCVTDTAARKVEDHFLAKGCAGDTGGGDSSTKYAYAYKKNSHTKP
jgi:hypothetical protein